MPRKKMLKLPAQAGKLAVLGCFWCFCCFLLLLKLFVLVCFWLLFPLEREGEELNFKLLLVKTEKRTLPPKMSFWLVLVGLSSLQLGFLSSIRHTHGTLEDLEALCKTQKKLSSDSQPSQKLH